MLTHDLSQAFSTTTPARYSDLARMTLIGRITADPKRYSDRTGGDFMRYTVATNDPLKAPAKEGDGELYIIAQQRVISS